jgi:probable HAF family extracellular repeat protein
MVAFISASGEASQAASGYNYTLISAPSAVSTEVHGINTTGSLAGQFTDAAGATHGFKDIAGVFTTIDAPGAVLTQAGAINNAGSVVGFYIDASGFYHGFLDSSGVITTLDVPLASATQAYGINDSNQIVGAFSDSTGEHGFLYNGTYSTIDVGTLNSTVATGINNAGQIVGHFAAGAGTTLSFLKIAGRTIDSKNVVTAALGINNSAVIVGIDGTETQFSSFVYQNGRFSPVRVKVLNSILTETEDINDAGEIVGWFFTAQAPTQGFIAVPSGGSGVR